MTVSLAVGWKTYLSEERLEEDKNKWCMTKHNENYTSIKE